MIIKWLPKPLRKPYRKIYWRVFYNFIGNFSWLSSSQYMNHGVAEEGMTVDNTSLLEMMQFARNLYLHLFKQAPPDGKCVMEIGCGRGAGLAVMHEFYNPSRTVGVDLSDTNIRRCRKTHGKLGIEFIRGDAEKQIFPDKTFDAVFNLESSHCYVSKKSFYSNVHSVLKDDGTFVYSDAFWKTTLDTEVEKVLDEVGFIIEKKEDITEKVFRSIKIKAYIKEHFMKKGILRFKVMNNFVAGPGSMMYECFDNGSVVYNLYVLKKKTGNI